MYNPQNIAKRIKRKAKEQNKPILQILKECELNKDAISLLAKGNATSYLSLAKIADSLDCSLDYLLDRKTAGEILDSTELKLIELYNRMSEDNRILLLAQAIQLDKEQEKST